MLRHRLDTDSGIFEIEIDGAVDIASYRAMMRDLDAELRSQGRLLVLEVVRRLSWSNTGMWLHDIGWGIVHARAMSRVALVTDKRWIAGMAGAASYVLPLKFRSFALGEEAAARAWLTA